MQYNLFQFDADQTGIRGGTNALQLQAAIRLDDVTQVT